MERDNRPRGRLPCFHRFEPASDNAHVGWKPCLMSEGYDTGIESIKRPSPRSGVKLTPTRRSTEPLHSAPSLPRSKPAPAPEAGRDAGLHS
jgi:hypothetical protein